MQGDTAAFQVESKSMLAVPKTDRIINKCVRLHIICRPFDRILLSVFQMLFSIRVAVVGCGECSH